jgi:hypothetical protein
MAARPCCFRDSEDVLKKVELFNTRSSSRRLNGGIGVREQLARPSFRHLGVHKKVRYLAYEKVNEIEEFFGDAKSGLSVDVLVGRSEKLAA